MKSLTARTLTVIASAFAFGIVVAVLKGGDAGWRDSIGNISAPWLLLPYFAGTVTRGWKRGAVMGLVSCLAALVGFYAAEAFVLDLGGHGVLTNLALTLPSGRQYFLAGMICGPIFGAIGAAGAKIRPLVTAAVVAFVLIGEPLAVFAWLASVGMQSADSGLVTRYPALWVGEIVLGVVIGGGIVLQSASQRGIL
jgi:Family of unknown function (DUF6518)